MANMSWKQSRTAYGLPQLDWTAPMAEKPRFDLERRTDVSTAIWSGVWFLVGLGVLLKGFFGVASIGAATRHLSAIPESMGGALMWNYFLLVVGGFVVLLNGVQVLFGTLPRVLHVGLFMLWSGGDSRGNVPSSARVLVAPEGDALVFIVEGDGRYLPKKDWVRFDAIESFLIVPEAEHFLSGAEQKEARNSLTIVAHCGAAGEVTVARQGNAPKREIEHLHAVLVEWFLGSRQRLLEEFAAARRTAAEQGRKPPTGTDEVPTSLN